jgi:hypothetical protein
MSDARAIYRALVAWLDHFAIDPPVARVDEFAQRADDPELTAIQDTVFKSPGSNRTAWSGAELASRVRSTRKRLARSASGGTQHKPALPPLNPS